MQQITTFLLSFSLILLSCNASSERKNELNNANSTDTLIETKKKEQKVELATLDKPYNPLADARADIDSLIAKAKFENKNIIMQAGGNWCIWCLRFEKFRFENDTVKTLIDSNYLYYHLNYSEENKNEEVLTSYGNPGKLGYPVFIILDKEGNLIHVQGSEPLEDGAKSYDLEKVISFLNKWAPQ